jgi:hypothetical protein
MQQESMTTLAVDIVTPVVLTVHRVIYVCTLVVGLVALIHALFQRSDAFVAAGKLSKLAWVGITFAALVAAALFPDQIFAIIAIVAMLVYLVDVRPAIREVTGGGGPSSW